MIFKEKTIILGLFLSFILVSCGETANIPSRNKANCGNGVLDSFETCDTGQVNCIDLDNTKYQSGKASCNNTCDNYDISSCILIGNDICGNSIVEGNETSKLNSAKIQISSDVSITNVGSSPYLTNIEISFHIIRKQVKLM